jgi:uncharacterized protein (TIGR03435 family)
MMRSFLTGSLTLALVGPNFSSGNPQQQKYEVASVKPCEVVPARFPGARGGGPGVSVSPGRASIECLTVDSLINIAYLQRGERLVNDTGPRDPADRVRGGPSWVRADRFTIEASAGSGADEATLMGPMLRALLEDRFKLKVSRATEEIKMYALTVAAGGLKIQPLADGACTPRDPAKPSIYLLGSRPAIAPGEKPLCGVSEIGKVGPARVLKLGAVSLDSLARVLAMDSLVLDQTGIKGLFNIHLEYVPNEADDPTGQTIYSALERQLGLKLTQTKGPRGYLVIDRIERPSPNLPLLSTARVRYRS